MSHLLDCSGLLDSGGRASPLGRPHPVSYYSMRVPFIVYADFEAFTKPVHTCQPNPEHSYTKQYSDTPG